MLERPVLHDRRRHDLLLQVQGDLGRQEVVAVGVIHREQHRLVERKPGGEEGGASKKVPGFSEAVPLSKKPGAFLVAPLGSTT